MNNTRRDWETNGLAVKITARGVLIQNWNANQGCVSGRKVLVRGLFSLPTDSDWEVYSNYLYGGAEDDKVKVIRKGYMVL